jgi:2-methylcitrate dehydratase PrpD
VGLEGKFSVFHAAAIGLVRGKAGLREFTDETVNDAEVKAVREKTTATADPSVPEDAVKVEVELESGERIARNVDHALGNLGRPMTDRELEEKFRDQATLILSAQQVNEVIALCWKTADLTEVRELIGATVPRQ